jgi:hypothetical protein
LGGGPVFVFISKLNKKNYVYYLMACFLINKLSQKATQRRLQVR